MSKLSRVIISEDELAAHWRMTPRRVRQWAEERVAIRASGGYDLLESDRALIAWYRADEPSKRAKRSLLKFQQLEREQKLEHHQRQWLTLAEVRALIDDAWSALWTAHCAALTRNLATMEYLANGRTDTTPAVWQLHNDVKGELRLARQRLEKLYQNAELLQDCDLRNGVFTHSRRIRALEAALGGDDEAEAADHRQHLAAPRSQPRAVKRSKSR